ncbi:MAG: ArsR family transcriptional regulator, partial [Anaerolineae bacterium]|nr:ArsR family transcriptional regulator [Gemmatimonadaceae bacterium]
RGQIIRLLRRSSMTVSELATELGLTKNAVRPHLTSLERDGLVELHAVRRGVGKPAQSYRITPGADALLPKAYAQVLGLMLSVLSERMPHADVEELLREVGLRVAAGLRVSDGDLRSRLQTAVEVLEALGGDAQLEEDQNAIVIRGYSCPLAAIIPQHPETCQFAVALLSEVVGIPMRELCDKGSRPRCCFEVVINSESAA